ncbi:MAG: isopentenyl-diphosphate Delta-isomerase [Patescibacteria group bacterium]
MSEIILVDENDQIIGKEDKLKAHQNGGQWHRAFSIFVFNSKGEFMLQKRAMTKYHSAGLWSNTTCSHPVWGEEMEEAVHRRVQEEMGFDCPMKELFVYKYSAQVGNGLTEKEVDHIWLGNFDGDAKPDPAEADEWKWIWVNDLLEDIKNNPDNYTFWFRNTIGRVLESL